MVAAEVNESENAPVEEDSKRDRRALLALLLLLLIAIVAIWLILSRMVSVPDVVGLTEDAARDALVDAGFVVGEIDEASPEDADAVDAGEVAAQQPSAGSRAFRGSEVDLSVALAGGGDGETYGPPGTGAPTGGYDGEEWADGAGNGGEGDVDVGAVDTRPIVPSVQNKTKSAAISALKNAGYVAVIGGYGPTTAGVLEGHVYYQDPPPTTRASRGTKVTIWISTGVPTEGLPSAGIPYPGPP